MRSASCPARRVVGLGARRCRDSRYGLARAGADNEAARDFCSRSEPSRPEADAGSALHGAGPAGHDGGCQTDAAEPGGRSVGP
jgi:hypothetical protein